MKIKSGTTPCTLKELCFPVELIDNPNRSNQEHSKIVTGVITEKFPFFSDDEIAVMRETMTDDEIDMKVGENPATIEVNSEIDLNYCSPRYELIPNDMIFPEVENVLRKNGIKFRAKYSHTNHARFYGSFIIDDKRFSHVMRDGGDVIKFVWNFQHSYNGLTKYKGIAGFYREICSNGLVVPVKEMKKYNLAIEGKHTASILRSLEEFNEVLIDVITDLPKIKADIVKNYEKLGGCWVDNPEDRIKEVLMASKINIIENSNFDTLKSITKSINKEAKKKNLKYGGRVNDWLIYNGINQYIHNDSRNIVSPEKRRETDSKVLEYMLEYV